MSHPYNYVSGLTGHHIAVVAGYHSSVEDRHREGAEWIQLTRSLTLLEQ